MNKVISIIKKSEAAYLSTMNSEGYPEIRALLNLANPDKYKKLVGKALVEDGEQLVIYFTTNTSSRKVTQIHENPKVSLYFCEPAKFQGACATGTIEEVTDMDLKADFWQTGWRMYYPKGKTDPDYALLKFTSKSIHCWYDLGVHNFGEPI